MPNTINENINTTKQLVEKFLIKITSVTVLDHRFVSGAETVTERHTELQTGPQAIKPPSREVRIFASSLPPYSFQEPFCVLYFKVGQRIP